MKTRAKKHQVQAYKRIRFSTFLRKYMLWPEGKDFSAGDDKTVLHEVPEGTDSKLIWTMLDCDGKLVITSGWHYVNRMGYLIAKVPHDAESIDVIGF